MIFLGGKWGGVAIVMGKICKKLLLKLMGWNIFFSIGLELMFLLKKK